MTSHRQEEMFLTEAFKEAAAGGPKGLSAREGLKGARRRGAGGHRGILHFLQPGRHDACQRYSLQVYMPSHSKRTLKMKGTTGAMASSTQAVNPQKNTLG